MSSLQQYLSHWLSCQYYLLCRHQAYILLHPKPDHFSCNNLDSWMTSTENIINLGLHHETYDMNKTLLLWTLSSSPGIFSPSFIVYITTVSLSLGSGIYFSSFISSLACLYADACDKTYQDYLLGINTWHKIDWEHQCIHLVYGKAILGDFPLCFSRLWPLLPSDGFWTLFLL